MDTFNVLEEQHEKIRELARRVGEVTSVNARTGLLREMLTVAEFHFYLEESFVFPVLEHFSDLPTPMSMLWDIHTQIKDRLQSLAQSDQENVEAELKRVFELISAHFEDEEAHIYRELRTLAGPELDRIRNRLENAVRERSAA